MPTKTTKGGHLKSHNRSASASTHNLGKHTTGTGSAIGLPHPNPNGDITRTKSTEKIRRTGSDLQSLQRVKSVLPYVPYQQHPVHQTQSDRGTGHQSKKRGITVLEVQTSSDGDEDEWISSESGAVTPADNDEEDGPPTPKDTISMMQDLQQLPPRNVTNSSTDIPSMSRAATLTNSSTDIASGSRAATNLDTEQRNTNNILNDKPSHILNTNADSDTTIQSTRSALPQLQFQSQARLHPMTRTQATSSTAAKQRTAPAVPPPAIGTRKPAPISVARNDLEVSGTGNVEPAQFPLANVNNESTNAASSTAGMPSITYKDQVPHPEPQMPLPELELSATPRVGSNPLRPTSPGASHSEAHRRPQVRQRPQSIADIRLVNTNVKSGNEEADDTFVESPQTELPPSRTRPPSTRSMRSIYHHPLIRTRSYAPSTPTLTGTAPPAFSPTTASPTLAPNAGSGMIWNNLQSNTENSHYFWPSKLRRKGSQSSVNSAATLPLTSSASSAALAPTTSSNVTAIRERPRTLSHTSAALSSLAAAAAHQSSHHYGFGVPSFVQHAPSRPSSPPLPVMFPPPPKPVHSMLPAALMESHASATAFQRIMAQSLMRIGKARTEKAG